jgi:hypothetical protein
MTVAIDADTGSTNNFFYSWAVFDVSGGTITHAQTIQSVSAQKANGNSETLAVSLGSNATTGNLVVACFGTFGTGGGSPAIPSGWTALVNQSQTYTNVSVFYRTDFASTTVTCSDLGDSIGMADATIMELAAPPSASVPDAPTSLSATPGDTQAALAWTAPASDGGAAITDYVIQWRKVVQP